MKAQGKLITELTVDQLDAIATHTGCLLSALHDVDQESQLMPAFCAELERIEIAAVEELFKRGCIGSNYEVVRHLK